MQASPPLTLVVMVALAALSAVGLVLMLGSGRSGGGRLGAAWRMVENGLGLFFMLGMLYTATAQVVIRYGLSDYLTVPWTEEFARLLLVWAALWGAALLQRSDDHISMTVVFDRFGPQARLVVRLLGDLTALGVLVVIAWYGWTSAYRQLVMYTVSLGLPISVFIFPVPLAATLMIVHTIGLMVRRLRGQPIAHAPSAEI